MLFLNILSFNFLQTPNKSLKFIKFRKSNVHRSVVVQTKHCQFALLFLLDLRCLKCSHSFFGDCLAPTIVHLQNLFLIKHTCCSNVVNSKVGKQTKACDMIIHNSWRYASHQPQNNVFSLSPFSRGGNLFSFLYTLIWFELNYIAICLCKDPNFTSHSIRFVVYSLPTAMICELGNHRLVHEFFLLVESEL